MVTSSDPPQGISTNLPGANHTGSSRWRRAGRPIAMKRVPHGTTIQFFVRPERDLQ
jgi:hypothetical protein